MNNINPIPTYFKITYNGKDITADITQYLIDLSYTDNVTGVSDDLEIKLEDVDGKWQNEWYPNKGALLNFTLGHQGGKVIQPNSLEIDEFELDLSKGSGDVVTIKAISGGINKALHTKRSHAHENKTLGEIVRTVAAKYNLTVVGTIENIAIGRVTQHREKDLTFLARLADEYGYSFSVKGSKLAFVKLTTLEAATKVATIDRTDCITLNIKDKGISVYQAANVVSHNPNQNKLIKSSYTVKQVANNDGVQFNYLEPAGTSLEVRTKTENEAQANVKSQAALHKVNSLQQTGDLTLPGNPLLVAGVNFELTGAGRLSGIWNILKSTHSANKAKDYTTAIEFKRIVPATQSGSAAKPKTVKPAAKPTYQVKPLINGDGIQFNTIVAKQDNVLIKK